MNLSKPKLELKQISFQYENENVLENLSFAVGEQECIALLGPSGCGKSTLLNVISGLYPPSGGSVFVDGAEVKGISSIFAYMPQKDLLLPWLNVLDNVCLYGMLHQIDLKQKALERLEEFGLKGYETAYPDELSGGMRQRAAFLRTALCDADILLLDEPFASLDVITREEMQEWLIRLRKTWNKTMILVTHDIDEAILLADRILILNENVRNISWEYKIEQHESTKEWMLHALEIKQEICARIREGRRQ